MDGRLIAASTNDVDKQEGIRRVKNDLQNRIDHYQNGTIIWIPFGELIPDHDHGNAPRKSNHDDTCAIGWEVRKGHPCQSEHDKWSHYPVQDHGHANVYPYP